MDSKTIKRIESQAPDIKILLNKIFPKLSPREKKALRRLLTKEQSSLSTVLEILDSISEKPKSFEEIAEEIGKSPKTVSLYIGAIATLVNEHQGIAIASTGRKRKRIGKDTRRDT